MGYFDCQKAAVVKRAPQASQSPSAHILQRVLLFAFDSAPHLGHFAKIWVMLMFLLVSIFKGFLTEETCYMEENSNLETTGFAATVVRLRILFLF